MCDLAVERTRIDAILAQAAQRARDAGVVSRTELARACVEALRAQYQDDCPDECIRKKCADYIAGLIDGRTARRPISACE